MKVLLVFVIIVSILLLAVVVFGLLRTSMTLQSPMQAVFSKGKAPKVMPSGLYRGTVPGHTFTWKGKKFDGAKGVGINVFDEAGKTVEQYPFRFYPGKGAIDKDMDVLKIDYSQDRDPWWLRFILDEVVETSPGKFLGKVHIQALGMTFSMGYFTLEKE